ncbi:metallophosphoesterase [Clostridium paraputrificum]|uniref:metallophosphoesterase n=1 Tax=Clostridium TaxID=1485 RepID=UPI003D3525B4
MILGLLIFIALYAVINYFIGKRIFTSINKIKKLNSKVYWILFSFIASSFLIYEISRKFMPHIINKILAFVGSYYLAVLFYIIILFPLAFLLTKAFKNKKRNFDFYTLSLIIVFLITIVGSYLSNTTKTKNYDILIDKPIASDSIKIALVSDIHLGDIIGNKRLSKMIDNLNSLNADMVLIAGDLVDMDLEPVLHDEMLAQLKNINSTYGTYIALGNHDFYTDRSDELATILSEYGINILRDNSILVNNEFYIIGRDDVTKSRYGGDRSNLEDILRDVDTSKPSIVIDHNPDYIKESTDNDIDLQVSGHTHRGQMFPINFITNILFPVDYGYGKLGNTNIVVSSGFGTWGPPIRIGSNSEIAFINLHN